MTNLEWLQQATKEEIAEVIGVDAYCVDPVYCRGRRCSKHDYDCKNCAKAWLEEEHEET